MYGSLVAAPDSIRTGLLNLFRPHTSPPGVATVLRSILWPLAILMIIHRSYVLATNGYITDDYGPVYRAVVNLKRGSQELGAYPYDAILARLKSELDALIAERGSNV